MGIIVVGMGITKFTDAYVSSKRTQMDMAGMEAAGAVPEAEEDAMAEGESMPSVMIGSGAPGSAPDGVGVSAAMPGAGGPDGGRAGDGPWEDSQAALTAENGPERSVAEGAALDQMVPDGAPGADGEAAGDRAGADAAGPDGTGAAEAAGKMGGGESARSAGDSLSAGATGAESALADGASKDTLDGSDPGASVLVAEDLGLKLEDYQYRFAELDDQIQRMRSAETENTVQSVRSAARTELRIWERELEAVYSLLIVSLDEEAAEELRTEQQVWVIERDAAAQEVSKKNSGSIESVEYMASTAASTRERAYQLVERYR